MKPCSECPTSPPFAPQNIHQNSLHNRHFVEQKVLRLTAPPPKLQQMRQNACDACKGRKVKVSTQQRRMSNWISYMRIFKNIWPLLIYTFSAMARHRRDHVRIAACRTSLVYISTRQRSAGLNLTQSRTESAVIHVVDRLRLKSP